SHVFYGGHVNGGYLHFLRSFLVDIPLGQWTEPQAAEVDRLVRLREAEGSAAGQAALEEAIEAHVAEALGLGEDEQVAIGAWAGGDPNWQARERVRTRQRRS